MNALPEPSEVESAYDWSDIQILLGMLVAGNRQALDTLGVSGEDTLGLHLQALQRALPPEGCALSSGAVVALLFSAARDAARGNAQLEHLIQGSIAERVRSSVEFFAKPIPKSRPSLEGCQATRKTFMFHALVRLTRLILTVKGLQLGPGAQA